MDDELFIHQLNHFEDELIEKVKPAIKSWVHPVGLLALSEWQERFAAFLKTVSPADWSQFERVLRIDPTSREAQDTLRSLIGRRELIDIHSQYLRLLVEKALGGAIAALDASVRKVEAGVMEYPANVRDEMIGCIRHPVPLPITSIARLKVRPTQTAVVVVEDRAVATADPGETPLMDLLRRTAVLLGPSSHPQPRIYFVSRRKVRRAWGTTQPIRLHLLSQGKDIGVRGHGTYALSVSDASAFVEAALTLPAVSMQNLETLFRSLITRQLQSLLTETEFRRQQSIHAILTHQQELDADLRKQLQSREFDKRGATLQALTIEGLVADAV
jgi:hypothetical protein